MAEEQATERGDGGAEEEDHRDDHRGVDADDARHLRVVADCTHRLAEVRLLEQDADAEEEQDDKRDDEQVEGLDEGPADFPGPAPEGIGKGLARGREDHRREGGEGEQDSEGADEHSQTRPGAAQNVDVDTAVESEPHRAGQQGANEPGNVEIRLRSPGHRQPDERARDERHEHPDRRPPLRPGHTARGITQPKPERAESERRERRHQGARILVDLRALGPEHERRVDPCRERKQRTRPDHRPAPESAPQPVVSARMQRPCDDSRDQEAQNDVENGVVDCATPDVLHLAAGEIEHGVSAECGHRPVAQVEEPHGAVDEGEAEGDERVDGPDPDSVQRHLEKSARRLGEDRREVEQGARDRHRFRPVGGDEAGEPGARAHRAVRRAATSDREDESVRTTNQPPRSERKPGSFPSHSRLTGHTPRAYGEIRCFAAPFGRQETPKEDHHDQAIKGFDHGQTAARNGRCPGGYRGGRRRSGGAVPGGRASGDERSRGDLRHRDGTRDPDGGERDQRGRRSRGTRPGARRRGREVQREGRDHRLHQAHPGGRHQGDYRHVMQRSRPRGRPSGPEGQGDPVLGLQHQPGPHSAGR